MPRCAVAVHMALRHEPPPAPASLGLKGKPL
eukprot:COSAG02_NODE_54809_length_294_cov_0.717949_1_plen_30_part_01